MKGLFWVTQGGDVVESTGPAESASGYRHGCSITHNHKVIPVKRVSSGAFLGTRRLDRLRPATAHEVEQARERGAGKP